MSWGTQLGKGRHLSGRKLEYNRYGKKHGLGCSRKSTLIIGGSGAQESWPGRQAVREHRGLPLPHQRVIPTPFCHQESSKSQCSGSLHFPNKTLHKLLNEASCPVEFNPSPISVYPFPQNVISPAHYWIPSEPCH